MVDAVNVPTGGGFNIPPVPNSSQQEPGFVDPSKQAPAGSFTQAHVDAQVAAALKAAQAAPAAQPAPAPAQASAPPVAISTTADDAVLESYTEAFSAIGTGIDMERAFGKALTHGNVDLIDTAYLAEKGGANAARLSTIAKAIVERVQHKATETTRAVHAAAGGVDAWNAASAAFNKNAEPYMKAVVIKMLESGDALTAQSGAKMVTDFAQNGGFTTRPAGLVQAGVAGGSAAQALDKESFQAAVRKLDRSSAQYNAQYDALVAQRRQGKQLGK